MSKEIPQMMTVFTYVKFFGSTNPGKYRQLDPEKLKVTKLLQLPKPRQNETYPWKISGFKMALGSVSPKNPMEIDISNGQKFKLQAERDLLLTNSCVKIVCPSCL